MSREATNKAIDLAEEGIITWEDLALMALKYMSEDDVADMLDANEYSDRFMAEEY